MAPQKKENKDKNVALTKASTGSAVVKLYKRIMPGEARRTINRAVLQGIGILPKYRDYVRQKKHFGKKNPDKTFYLIRIESTRFGLFAIVSYVLDHIQYAQSKGYIPVVDLKNYVVTCIQNKNDEHKKNAWEDFYKAGEYSLEEVYESKNVILCNTLIEPKCRYLLSGYGLPKREDITYIQPYIERYLQLNEELKQRLDAECSRLLEGRGKVLGIALRREFSLLHDCNTSNASYHPNQVALETLVKVTNEYKKLWSCNSVFICTDDRETLEFLKKEIGEEGIALDRTMHHYCEGEESLLDIPRRFFCEYELSENDEPMNEGDAAKEYLIETYLLSKCDCLLGGMAGNVRMALLLNNNKYEHVEIMEK